MEEGQLHDNAIDRSNQHVIVGENEGLKSPEKQECWTEDIVDSDHVRFFRQTNWAATPIGPLETWGPALRLYTHMLFADSRPAALYWGPKRVAIYNKPFVPLAAAAHPKLMGDPFEVSFREIWPNIKPVFDLAESSKQAVDVLEMPLMVERNGYVEETIFTGNFNPLIGDDGKVAGFYNAVFEVTRQKLGERRTAMLNLISSPVETYTRNTVGTHIIKALEVNPSDIPMALLYHVDEESEPGKCLVRLQGDIGLPLNHKLRKETEELSSANGLMPTLKRAKSGPITIDLSPELDGVIWKGFGEPSKFIGILPLINGRRLLGFLVVGLNPRRPIDEDHNQLIADLARVCSHTIATAVGVDESRKRQERLERELADSEKRINYMAKHAAVGLQHTAINGETLWANQRYYELTNYPNQKAQSGVQAAMDPFLESDQAQANEAFDMLCNGEPLVQLELRLKRKFAPPVGDPEAATVLVLAFPYYENGIVTSMMSCLTDVSTLKWAEKWQARAAEEAREAKRQQEEFIDAISHEVRNPLSAIFQLADQIASVECAHMTLDKALTALQDNAEAAKTILLCANHQKRIVDDVLTLSKLDFMLLSLTPTDVQIPALVNGAVKMFGTDTNINNIKMTVIEEVSTIDYNWVRCDQSRITQIFINLLGNAIKFTRGEEDREITIKYGASLLEPKNEWSGSLYWAPKQKGMEDITLQPDWGNGEPIYLKFSISDTGTGMSDDEMKKLFKKFEQASSKTFVKYGGSGLGLFISQRLSEKQGGGIGVMSKPGEGSTFAFYIKARRTDPPVTRPASLSSSHRATSIAAVTQSISNITIKKEIPDYFRVLLVEDNIVNQQILRKQLLKAGCIVYVANHGLEALDVLKTTTFWYEPVPEPIDLDFVLMDWEMPVMDGLACSREIRKLQKEEKIYGHVPIIAITANTRKEQIDKALKAGIDEVMPKPFVINELMAKMKSMMG